MNAKLKSTLLVTGAAVLGYAGLRALLGLRPDAEADFFNWTGPSAKGVRAGTACFDLPIKYYRDDCFLGLFSASYDPICALLPSKDLYPVRLPGGRVAVSVFAFNYLETSIGRYGEIGVAVHCTFGREAPPLLPLALEGRFQDYGFFVHLLPVTSLVARDIGRALWNFPKLVADMDFEKRPAYQRVRWSQGDEHVLTLTVQQRGVPIKDNRPLVCYTAMKGSLIETRVPIRSVYQLGLAWGSGTIQLGSHKIADHLREIDLSTTAIATRNYLSRSAMLPEGQPIGPADPPFQVYAGKDRPLGRFTVSYDDAEAPIDLYAEHRLKGTSKGEKA